MVEAPRCSAKLKLMPVGGQKVKVSFSPKKVWLLSVQQCHIGLMKRRGQAVVAKKKKTGLELFNMDVNIVSIEVQQNNRFTMVSTV